MDKGVQVQLFDTTLRDGQQCPGAGMSFEQNLQYARGAAELRIDVLEAGFPSASETDFEIVRSIAEEFADRPDAPVVAALCQLRDEQIDRTIEALTPALSGSGKTPRLHVYVPVDPVLMQASLGEKANKTQIERDVADFVERAARAGMEVEFSPEGYSRMADNFDFVTDLIIAAVGSGARVVNCPDTIGGAIQLEGEDYFVEKMNRHAELVEQHFPGSDVVWSVHCHNDFGLAVQNSINGVVHGPARQIEGCINGVGERAGNAALEQIVLILDRFGKTLDPPLSTGVNLEKLGEACDFISSNMLSQQAHSPVSGANATRHSSGGHTNAVLNNPLSYQPFDPRKFGKEISLAFGPLSGGNHARSIVNAEGFYCEEDEKTDLAQFIKSLYKERRKGITDQELMRGYFEFRKPIAIESFDYSRSKNKSRIELIGTFFGQTGEIVEEHEGRDSALAALKTAIDQHFHSHIQSHQSQSEGTGINAISVSTILISCEGNRTFTGEGRDQDIEISAMKALIDAVNRAYVETKFKIKER